MKNQEENRMKNQKENEDEEPRRRMKDEEDIEMIEEFQMIEEGDMIQLHLKETALNRKKQDELRRKRYKYGLDNNFQKYYKRYSKSPKYNSGNDSDALSDNSQSQSESENSEFSDYSSPKQQSEEYRHHRIR